MIIAAVLLVCLFSKTEGATNLKPDDLTDTSKNRSDDFVTGGSGGGKERGQDKPCCISGNFIFHSIDGILSNMSSNTMVNITTDVVLSSNMTLKGLENIMIIGHRNPVVNCNDVGAVMFISCKNITIEGIQWEGCGSKDYPGVEFYNSSNVSFERCSFHNSKGRSVLLSQVSGNVYINNCNFTHKIEYSGHGAAVHYSPNTNSHGQHKLVIQNSQFIFNRAKKSVVYIDGSGSRITGHVYLQDNVFVNNKGVPIYSSHTNLHISGSVLFKANTAESGGGIYSKRCSVIFYDKSNVNFISSFVTDNGGANYSRLAFGENSIMTFKDNHANFGGTIYSDNSNITFDGNSSVTFNNNNASDYGGAVYCQSSSHITFDGNSSSSSHITFDGNSSVTFNNNEANHFGGAVFCYDSSHITFDGNSSVTFSNNFAGVLGGAVFCQSSSHITFDGNSSVTFNNNEANHFGGAVFCYDSSHITFDGNSSVTFSNNFAGVLGGAVFCQSSSHITFDGSSSVTYSNNFASVDGGAVYCYDSTHITFDGNSSVTFNNNNASDYGGAVYCQSSSHITFDGNSSSSSHITFDGNSSVTFNNNEANHFGGAVFCYDSSHITFDGNSSVTFSNNFAGVLGGAVFCQSSSHITFDGSSSVTYSNNFASVDGGAVYCYDSTHITFDGNSSVTFNNNNASDYGGAVYCQSSSHITFDGNSSSSSHITFDGNSSVTFNNNEANHFGGAVFCYDSSHITFDGNSSVTFSNNFAGVLGGAVFCQSSSHITFDGSSSVTYSNNFASVDGGAVYCYDSTHITFDGNSSVTFNNNKASDDGGAVCCIISCLITFDGSSSVTFNNNDASKYGGAIYVLLSIVTFEGDILVNFNSNTAENGGTISAVKSSITLAVQPQLWFFNNSARASGGAIHLSDHFFVNICNNSHITFYHNNANRRGGAIYCDLTKSAENKIIFNSTDIVFDDNTDLTGSDFYIEMPTSCDEMCLNNSIINKRYNHFDGVIKTSPRKLELNDSAVTCIDNNYTNCQNYLTRNKMLGQEIIINTCVKDYYNQPAGPTQFVLSSEDQNHHIIGSNNVLISCEVFGGVSVGGKRILNATNYSMIITSYEGSASDIREFFIELIIALSPCHPGFHYDNTTQTCVCYSDSDIVSCSGSTSSIKSGYWFGEVDDKATVTICPNNYCNFTCCETVNGFFELSPDRANQCNSQRSGTACGGCKDGYTLSFDSIECVSVDKCTTGQILLVVILSVIYWITLVIAVFAMMYYRIGIGYLYAITYYCSIVDIILNQSLETTPALFTTVSIMSSIAKVTPQFLGQFCLIRNMSGIDQQFIHYSHPLAVTFIIAMICLSARISYKVSSLVSRGIIHVICFLLLLSYSSVATTSLLIVRPLKFTIGNTVQVKTYLSPDIDYFQGRHFYYAIVAILCTIPIAIGLPLLLLLEPFLNRKINFIRIKPLLDQFQGCYKDNCRYFAAYYMVCRLVIIGIFISNFSNNNTTQYLMLAVSAVFALVHFVQKPYVNKTLNLFDGLVLLSITFIAMIPLIDRSGLGLLLPITALLPLVSFVGLIMLIHRKNIKKLTKYFKPIPRTTNNNVEVPMREYGVVVDDNMRKNATICEITDNPESEDDAIHYRESFMEVMNETED
ncbi:uncharacterized protein [Dysidea avara]|uniref:uncharacterized protein n=1 Tax=Dysidea avara TaxID=196820 RepID=UPI0033309623